MEKIISLFCIILLPLISGHSSVIVNKNSEVNSNRGIAQEQNHVSYHSQTDQPKLELIIDVKNFSQHLSHDKKKHRRERIRKRKEKGGKISRQKGKTQKPVDYIDRQVLRNNEKVNLVRNRTIEILKNGMRILSAGENYTQNGNKSNSRVNETLLEKILSSAVSRQNVLSSGTYKIPIGVKIYESKQEENETEMLTPGDNLQESDKSFHLKRQNKKQVKFSDDAINDYDYDSAVDFNSDFTNKSYKTFSNIDYDSINLDQNVGTILEQIVSVLKNLTDCSSGNCSESEPDQKLDRKFGVEDPCLKWLNCKESLNLAFFGENNNLPSCPCTYPSTIFYDDAIWDEKQKRFFRWRDASSESERLDIYKPGASYCIRSLLTQGSSTISSQQCCYDRKLQLLTRGSGAGTINFISPDVSKRLHYTVDILPWRLCKGDFTRYNMARNPNNGNECPENPDEQQYQLEVKLSKIF